MWIYIETKLHIGKSPRVVHYYFTWYIIQMKTNLSGMAQSSNVLIKEDAVWALRLVLK